MASSMFRFLCVCLALAPALAADLKSRLDDLVTTWPALAGASVGLKIVSLTDGRVLYEQNADRLLVPASNMKLFTTALALSRLGPDYRLGTQICAERGIEPNGTLPGDLVLVGGGDPSLSDRPYPYRANAAGEGFFSFRPVEDLADQLVARGLKRVQGDIVGDDRRYVWSPYAGGWALGDVPWGYGAPVSALIVDDNSFAVNVRPGANPGDPAQISLAPAFEYFYIENRVRTVENGERQLQFDRDAGGREVHIWGRISIGDSGMTQLLAVDDPARYAAEVLRDALERRGVSIRGASVARHRFLDDAAPEDKPGAGRYAVVLAKRDSPPLAQVLQVVDKVSQNLHAEVMLREVGAARRPFGSRDAGLSELRDFLKEAGIADTEYRFGDGSGLSRNTLVTPSAIVKLLGYMYRSEYRDTWIELLPVAGVDGTLRSRFADHPEAHAIHAKTGTLSHVRANSGYVDSPVYGPLAFSFLVNNYTAPTGEISRFIDALELALLN